MTNLVKCSRCNQIMPNEDKDNHRCRTPLKTMKKVKAYNYFIYEDEEGLNINVDTVDGTGYIFVISKKEFISLPDEYLQHNESDEDFTEPD